VFQFYYDYLHEKEPFYTAACMNAFAGNTSVWELPSSIIIPHWLYMCQEAQTFVDAGCVKKAMRWLGFLQGALWANGYFTLDELKHHSMP